MKTYTPMDIHATVQNPSILPLSQEAALAREKYFWGHVEKTESCWLWKGATRAFGYGSFAIGGGRSLGAHRFSWVLSNGPITDPNLCVCHKCDNPACVNPAHLFLGTRLNNVRDMDAKGRRNNQRGPSHSSITKPETRPRGSKHPMSILTEDRVIEIRELASKRKMPQADIARRFGISVNSIGNIVRGRTWKHVSALRRGGPEVPLNHGDFHHNAVLNATKVRKIRAEYATGKYRQNALAVKHGVSESLMNSLVNRKIWKHVH